MKKSPKSTKISDEPLIDFDLLPDFLSHHQKVYSQQSGYDNCARRNRTKNPLKSENHKLPHYNETGKLLSL
jgi:hypothetical protein